MIFAHWRARRANRQLIDRLHGKIMAAARRPALYAEFGAPDTFEGRFEMLALHAGLVMRALTRRGGLGAELSHEIADSVFRHFDATLRELGYGDVAVAKRLTGMAEGFYGRLKAYDEALDSADSSALPAALARNVLGVAGTGADLRAARLADFVRATAQALERVPVENVARGDIAFPDVDVAAQATHS